MHFSRRPALGSFCYGRPGRALTSSVGAIRGTSSRRSGFRQCTEMARKPRTLDISSTMYGSSVPSPHMMRSRTASAFRHLVGLQRSTGTGF